jgi:hypothetical protein
MEDLLSNISDYLFSERTRTIDVIAISIITTFVTFLLARSSTVIWSLIVKGLQLFWSRIKRLNEKYIKQQINLNEMIEIENRLENGGKLKWYEKKPYKKYQDSIPENIKTLKSLTKAVRKGDITLSLKPTQPNITEIKLPDVNNRD